MDRVATSTREAAIRRCTSYRDAPADRPSNHAVHEVASAAWLTAGGAMVGDARPVTY
jgi:hypothetical protein